MTQNWFATWFDSSYYHTLYQHRDDAKAHFFMDNLVDYLKLPKDSTVLDLACGKGRHSIYLAKKKLAVVGVDLSPESIAYAQQFEQENLSFRTHDMRDPIDFGSFDAIFNLFTSFGYFETEAEHIDTLLAMKNGLKSKDSVLVIDFFNAKKVIHNLVLVEEKIVDGITFHIKRWVENGAIIKDIRFEDKGQDYHFQEKVHGFDLAKFQAFFETVGFELITTFGEHDLTAFDEQNSDRLIMVVRPK